MSTLTPTKPVERRASRLWVVPLLVLLALAWLLPAGAETTPPQFLPDIVAIAEAQAEAAARAAAHAEAASDEARRILVGLDLSWLLEAAQQASVEAQDSAMAVTEAAASAEMYVENIAQACADAVARAEASAQACAEAAARAQAVAETLAAACAGASATASASVQACAEAMAEAEAVVDVLVTAVAEAYAEARANVQACDQALDDVQVYAQAIDEQLATAEARALAHVEVAAEALAHAEAEARASAETAASARAHAVACAAAHAHARADAEAAAKAYSEAQDLGIRVKEHTYDELPGGCGYVVAEVEGSVDGAVTASAEASSSAEAAAEATAIALAASSARAEAAAAAEARAKAQASASARAHAEAFAAAEAVAKARAKAQATAEAAATAVAEASALAEAQAEACAEAQATAEAAAEAMARAVGEAGAVAEARAEALAEACAQATAAAIAAAEAIALAEAHARADAEAAASACAWAEAAAEAMAQALASAEAAAEASAQAAEAAYVDAQNATTDAFEQISDAIDQVATYANAAAQASADAAAEAAACARAAASAHAEAQASAEAAGTGEVYTTAYAAAEAMSSAEVIAHATACAQASARTQAAADGAVEALARVRTLAAEATESVAEAAMRSQTEALAGAHALAKAEAEVAVGVEALAEARAEALAAAYAAAEAATSAYAETVVSAEASAEAQAEVFTYAHAAAMAQATAEAEVAVGVQAMANAFAQASVAAYAAAMAEVRAMAEAYATAQALAEAEAEAYASAQVCALASAKAEATAAAAAEAYVRTRALAEANAQALAQASVVARAAARAAATAHTSVDVVTNIGMSIDSFIDPSCLEDVCPPACPPLEILQWDCCVDWVPAFGELFTITDLARPWDVCPVPDAVRSRIADLQPTHAEIGFSDLPAGLEFSFDLDNLQGRLSGQVPADGGTWLVRVDLHDADDCLVALLFIDITIPCEVPCPEPQAFEWDCCDWTHSDTELAYSMMMEADAELPFSMICSVPDHLRSGIAALGATKAVVTVSDLPHGLEFFFDLESLQGIVYGRPPSEPGSWKVTVELTDEHDCVVAELLITVTIPCEEVCTTHTFEWHFGDFRAGMTISRAASLPRDIRPEVEALEPSRAVISESDLPASLEFEFLVDRLQGRISGQVPGEGGNWTVQVDLFDAAGCHVVELFVTITSDPPECPATRPLSWDFGEVEAGTRLTRRTLPTTLSDQIRAAGITRVTQVSSTLPSGLTLSLDVGRDTASLTGLVPERAGSHRVVFTLFDDDNCERYRLTVTLTVTLPTPDLSVRITRTAVAERCVELYSHAITIAWEAAEGRPPITVRPSIVMPDGTQVRPTPETYRATGLVTINVQLSEGGVVRARVDATDAAGQTGRAYQVLRLDPCVLDPCPATEELSWDFGEVRGGIVHVLSIKEVPTSVLNPIRAAGITDHEQVSSTLPAGVTLNLDLRLGAANLTGRVPAEAAKYQVVFALFDEEECERFQLTVTLNVGEPERVCTYRVSPTSLWFSDCGYEWDANRIQVSTQAGCAWTVTNPCRWVTVSPTRGTGSGTVTVSVAANTGTTSRTCTLTIAGQRVQITQDGQPAVERQASVAVTAVYPFQPDGLEGLSASRRPASWLVDRFEWTDPIWGTVADGLPYRVDGEQADREVALALETTDLMPVLMRPLNTQIGLRFPVQWRTQPLPWLDDATLQLELAGFVVVMGDLERMQERLDDVAQQWIPLPAAAARATHFTLRTTLRAEFATIVAVYRPQDGRATPECTYSVSPTSMWFSDCGQEWDHDYVEVSTMANCSWTVTNPCGWVRVSPTRGTGGGIVTVSVAANTGTTRRTCTLTIAGQRVQITQDGRAAVTRQAEVDVRAVYVTPRTEGRMGTRPTTSHLLRNFEALPGVPVRAADERTARPTPFTLRRAVNTQVGLQFPVRMSPRDFTGAGDAVGIMPASHDQFSPAVSGFPMPELEIPTRGFEAQLLGFAVRVATSEQWIPLPAAAERATAFTLRTTLRADTLIIAVYRVPDVIFE